MLECSCRKTSCVSLSSGFEHEPYPIAEEDQTGRRYFFDPVHLLRGERGQDLGEGGGGGNNNTE